MLDTFQYENKPKNQEGVITNRLMSSLPASVSVQELSETLLQGQSFTPAVFGLVDGSRRRRESHWESQQVVCVDFDNEPMQITVDDAVETFKDIAAFIYKTFGHTDEHPRFRAVIVLDRPVTDLQQMKMILEYYKRKYPSADPTCFEVSRMFYGGKGSIWSEFENVVSVDELMKEIENTGINVKNKTDVLRANDNKIYNLFIISPFVSDDFVEIKREDIESLKARLDRPFILYHSRNEMLDYFKQQSLFELLGIDETSGNFSCVFHEDNNPSANIMINEDGHNVYHCFSSNCQFGSGTIVQVIEYITGKNRVQTLQFLREIYNVHFEEFGWVKEQRELIEENIRFIKSKEFEMHYKELYDLIKPYKHLLIALHNKALENIITEDYTDELNHLVFFSSVKHLSNYADVNTQAVCRELGMYAFLGLVRKLPQNSIPDELLQRAMEIAKRNGQQKLVNYFGLIPYSKQSLAESKEKAIELKNNAFTRKGWGREMLVNTFGEEEANRVFPQYVGNKIAKKNVDVSNGLIKTTLELIEQNGGYVLESKIADSLVLTFKGQKEFKRTQLKRIMASLLNGYGLKRVRLNKELREQYELTSVRGNPYIIVKE